MLCPRDQRTAKYAMVWFNPSKRRINPPFTAEEFTVTYNLGKKDNPAQTEEITFRLLAMLVHHGDLLGGHYTTLRRRNDDWWNANDTVVTKVENFEEVLRLAAGPGSRVRMVILEKVPKKAPSVPTK
eukprot:g41204.t1